MPLQIGICDDRAEDIRTLSEALYAYDNSFHILYYSDGESLLEEYLQRKRLFDILFLDIYMPKQSGIEVARLVRASMRDVKIIFISSSNEHYHEAYDVFAFNYLIKPVNHEKLNRVLDQALMDIRNQRRQQIHIRYKGTSYRIFCIDILYIESNDKMIYFHMSNGTTLQCYGKIDEVFKQLPEDSFLRCHQSFVVNLFHVSEIDESNFRIGRAVIRMSKKYQKASKDKYFEYLFTHMNKGEFL